MIHIDAWWQAVRLALIWFGIGLGGMLLFFSLLAAADWLATVFQFGMAPGFLIFMVTLATLFSFKPLSGWVHDLIDQLFFPDTADIRENIEAACRHLPKIANRFRLEHFLVNQLPASLHVDYIVLATEDAAAGQPGLSLPLAMGGRSLGTLVIGPKCSGRSFIVEERLLFQQLQEQVSLLLSVMTLQDARAEAERIDELKDNFLTNISHELRTPLNAVINATGLVADGELGPISPEQADYLSRSVGGSEYLMNLLDDILDITRIESGELTLNLGPVDLKNVVDDVLPLVNGMLQNKDLLLKVELADELPPIIADRLRVRQILLNLLSNAVKFTKAGYILVRAWPEADHLVVSVEDTGIGIATEDQPLIFQDYQQIVDQKREGLDERRPQQIGTGLGMPITQALVELHGGQIGLRSQLGQGTTFTFTLPIVRVAEKIG